MKEIQQLTPDKQEIKATVPVKKETKLVGTVKINKGHKCFEINKETLEVAPAKYESNIEFSKISPDGYVKRKVIIKENHFYVTALNAHNALKKYIKVLHHFVNQNVKS